MVCGKKNEFNNDIYRQSDCQDWLSRSLAIRARVADDLVACEARVSTKRAASPEATMVKIVRSMFTNAPTPYLTLADVTAFYNDATASRGELPLSAKAVGWMVRGKLGLETTKTRGVFVIAQSERRKIDGLAMRYGLQADEPNMTSEIAALGFLARSAKISA
jgi:hypothetical protein